MYTSYFGFRVAPFSVTPDPRFFYTNPIYQEALAALRYGIEGKKGFILVTGEAGTGKTTVLRKLSRDLEAGVHSVFIFNPHVSFTGLLRIILRELGLGKQKSDKSTMIEELNGYLIEQAKKGCVVSLLIDEAQNLSDQTLQGLRLLSNLETDTDKLIQIVLIGQPELEQKLDRPALRQLKQRVALQCRLVPLNGCEVLPYIDLRLQAAGYEGTELFDPDTIERIALHSRGIPRLINIICDNALLIAYATSQKRVLPEMVNEVARDMRVGLQIKAVETEALTDQVTSGDQDETLPAVTAEPPRHEPRQPARFGVWITLFLFVCGSATAVIYTMQTKNRLSGHSFNVQEKLIEERAEFVKDEPSKRLAGSTVRSSEPKKAPTPAKSKPVSPRETQPQDPWFASPILRIGEPRKIQTAAASQFDSTPKNQPEEKRLSSPISRPGEPERSREAPEPEALSAEPDVDLLWNARNERLAFAEPDEVVNITQRAEVKSEMKRYRVKEGDYLYRILRDQFGIETNDEMHHALNRVKELNAQKKNWDVLFAGEVLLFPDQLASFRRFR